MNIDWSLLMPMLYAWGMLATLMVVTWVIYLKTRLPSIVDVMWGVGITLGGLFHLSYAPASPKTWIMAWFLIFWGARLALFLYVTRIRQNEVDHRYEEIVSTWKSKNVAYFFNYQLQAFLILFLITPFYAYAQVGVTTWGWLDMIAMALICVGILFETLADYQLYAYKQNPQGRVCRVGLWSMSRHPNYFFEWLIWVGFSLFVMGQYQQPMAYVALVAPVMIFMIVYFLTGRITERNSLKSRKEAFEQYQKEVNYFVPGPSK